MFLQLQIVNSQTNQLKKKVSEMVNMLILLKGISVCSNMYILELHKFSLKF